MPADAAYYRAWRAAHPEYRARQNALRRARRARMTPDERKRDRGVDKRKVPVYEPLAPVWSSGDDLIVLARSIVGRGQHGTHISFLEDEMAIDAIGECVLALLEGRDPIDAVEDWYRRERGWLHRIAPLTLE